MKNNIKIHEEDKWIFVAREKGWVKHLGTHITINNVDLVFVPSRNEKGFCLLVVEKVSGVIVFSRHINYFDAIAANTREKALCLYQDTICFLDRKIKEIGVNGFETMININKDFIEYKIGSKPEIVDIDFNIDIADDLPFY
ncbi:hypothetical protein HB837_15455 [Listeria innocua]|uniref:hypothetical protein n=1 Tax=Listeria innocua TaxID=1642 RepID=UPI0016287DA3|nr:hypothetical protein [Listeria innocua]MBC1353806.1 hypothetical protein [Listeria innocua]